MVPTCYLTLTNKVLHFKKVWPLHVLKSMQDQVLLGGSATGIKNCTQISFLPIKR